MSSRLLGLYGLVLVPSHVEWDYLVHISVTLREIRLALLPQTCMNTGTRTGRTLFGHFLTLYVSGNKAILPFRPVRTVIQAVFCLLEKNSQQESLQCVLRAILGAIHGVVSIAH